MRNNITILVINGSPGAGKSTTAGAISDVLYQKMILHALIDFDELGLVHPKPKDLPIQWMNLKSVLENFSKVEDLEKIIIPIAIDSQEILDQLKSCLPNAEWIICELLANKDELLKRVTNREPDDYWREKLRKLVINYADRDETTKFGELKVRTDDKTIGEVANEILLTIKWI